MSKSEKIHIRTLPVEKTLDFMGFGVEAEHIRDLNKYGSEENKRVYIKNRRKETAAATLALAGIVGGNLGYSAIKNHGNPFGEKNKTPIENHGDHHGVSHNSSPGTGTVHTEKGDFHVTQTTESQGGIGTAVAAEKQGDHFVEVDPITFDKK